MTVKTMHRFSLRYSNKVENLSTWLTTHGEGYNWYAGTRIDPHTFEPIINVQIEDELFAVQFKLAWSEYLETTN